MLGRVAAESSLLETRVMRRHLVTKGSFYERLADHGHEVFSDDDFEGIGATTFSLMRARMVAH